MFHHRVSIGWCSVLLSDSLGRQYVATANKRKRTIDGNCLLLKSTAKASHTTDGYAVIVSLGVRCLHPLRARARESMCNQFCADMMLLRVHVKWIGVSHPSTADLRWRFQQETALRTNFMNRYHTSQY